MHLSSESESPHYCPASCWVSVRFQGAEIKDCVEADEEGRRVLRYQKNEQGRIRTDAAGNAVKEWEYGAVSVEPMPEAPDWVRDELRARGWKS